MENKDNEYMNKSGVSKKTMTFLGCLLTLLGICYGIIYFGFYNNDNNHNGTEKNEKNNLKTCTGTLKYLVDDKYDLTDNIAIDEQIASKFYNDFKDDKLEKADKLIKSYTYDLEVCDLKIYYDDKSKFCSILYGDDYFKLGDNEEYVVNFINNIMKDIQKVYFVDVVNGPKTINLTNDDKKKIYELTNNMELKDAYIDLTIKGDYLLIVDDRKFYLDNFDGYAIYNKKLVKLNNELCTLLKPYLTNNNGCCSCCPDLKLGESCVALCCPCEES